MFRTRGSFERGQKVGELTILFSLGKNEHGARIWACKCSCGRCKVMTTGNLNQGIRRGRAMVCKACSNEALVARWRQWKQSPKGRHHQNSWLRASLCELWNTTGSLYSDGYDRSETERVRDEVAEELGFYPDEADQNVRIDPLWAEEHRQAMTDEHMELTWDEAEGVDWFEMRGVSSELPVLREEAATVGILRQRRRAQLLDEIWSQL